MATHSSILAWRIPWKEEPGRLQSMGSQELDTTYWLNYYHHPYHFDKHKFVYDQAEKSVIEVEEALN